MKKLISIIIPAYNEEDCVQELSKRLQSLFAKESNYDFEAIIVENGSLDSTWEKLKQIANSDSRFKILKLSRNLSLPPSFSLIPSISLSFSLLPFLSLFSFSCGHLF